MSRLTWDSAGEKRFETGIDHCVLYPSKMLNREVSYPNGVAWNGITSVSENPEGADAEDFYADNIKYLSLRGVESFSGSISAYMYPEEFAACDGSAEFDESSLPGVYLHQQTRQMFGLSYRTIDGNDINPEAAYKYHIIYGATVSPSDKEYSTVNDSPEPIEFSWDFDTTPVPVQGFPKLKPVSLITISDRKLNAAQIKALQNALWGTEGESSVQATDARLPLPHELFQILSEAKDS